MTQYIIQTVAVAAIVLIGVIFAVYLIILKKNGWLGGNSDFYRCPNQDCKGIFKEPIELKDLSETPIRVYPACPECGVDLDSFFGSRVEKMSKTSSKTLFHQKKSKIKSIKEKFERKESEEANKVQRKGSKLRELTPIEHLRIGGRMIDVSDDSGCQYFFGYLATREKREEIPDPCLECPRSLDCMLSELKSEDSVDEIRKWYPVKT